MDLYGIFASVIGGIGLAISATTSFSFPTRTALSKWI